MMQTIFPNNDVVFQDDMTMPPFIQLEVFSHGVKSMKVNFTFTNFSGQQKHQICSSWNHSGQFCTEGKR
jgi:hypothetical protein